MSRHDQLDEEEKDWREIEKEQKKQAEIAKKKLIHFFVDLDKEKVQPTSSRLSTQLGDLISKRLFNKLSSRVLTNALWYALKVYQHTVATATRRLLYDRLLTIFWSDDFSPGKRAELLEKICKRWMAEADKVGFDFNTVLGLLIPLNDEYFDHHVRSRLGEEDEFHRLVPSFLKFVEEKQLSWEHGCRLLLQFFDHADNSFSHTSVLANYFHDYFSEWFPSTLLNTDARPENYRLKDLAFRLFQREQVQRKQEEAEKKEEEEKKQDVAENPLARLKHEPITGDGHCFFRAIRGAIEGKDEENVPRAFRQQVAEWMQKAWDDLRPHYAGTDDGFRRYIEKVRHGNQWGDEPEIAAIQRQTNRPIIVIQQIGPTRIPGNLENYPEQPIFLYFNNRRQHYDVFSVRQDSNGREILDTIVDHQRNHGNVNYPPEASGSIHDSSSRARRGIISALLLAIERQPWLNLEKGKCIALVYELFKPAQYAKNHPFDIDTLLTMTHPLLVEKLPGEDRLHKKRKVQLAEDRAKGITIQWHTIRNYYLHRLECYSKKIKKSLSAVSSVENENKDEEASKKEKEQKERATKQAVKAMSAAFIDTDFIKTFPSSEKMAPIHQKLLTDLVAFIISRSEGDDFITHWVNRWCGKEELIVENANAKEADDEKKETKEKEKQDEAQGKILVVKNKGLDFEAGWQRIIAGLREVLGLAPSKQRFLTDGAPIEANPVMTMGDVKRENLVYDPALLVQTIPYMIKGLIQSGRKISEYAGHFIDLVGVYLQITDDADDIAAFEQLRRITIPTVGLRNYVLFYAIVAHRFFVEQGAPNQFKYAHVPGLAWHCLGKMLNSILDNPFVLNQDLHKVLKSIFVCITSRDRLLQQGDPETIAKIKAWSARTAIACFMEPAYLNLMDDAVLFQYALNLWHPPFNQRSDGIFNSVRAIDSIMSFYPDSNHEDSALIQKHMLATVLYAYYEVYSHLHHHLPEPDSGGARRRQDELYRVIGFIRDIIQHHFLDNPAELTDILATARAKEGYIASITKLLDEVMRSDEQQVAESKEAEVGGALIVFDTIQDRMDNAARLAQLPKPPSENALIKLSAESPRPAPRAPSTISGWDVLLRSTTFVSISWGAVQFALLADYDHFPDWMRHPAAVLIGISLLSIPQWVYEFEEAKEASHRKEAAGADAHSGPVIRHKSHVDYLNRGFISLFCCAEGLMRAMGMKSVLERFLGIESGLQWILFAPIFGATIRHFRLGEGYAFQRLFDEGLFALDHSAIHDGETTRIRSWLVRLGALLLSLSAFPFVAVESYHFLSHELLSQVDEGAQKNWSYFISGFLGVIAAVFAACKLGVGFKRLCYRELSKLLAKLCDKKWAYFKASHWMLLLAAASSGAYGLSLYRVLQQGIRLSPFAPANGWDWTFRIFSGLTAMQYAMVRTIPTLVHFAEHPFKANTDTQRPRSQSGWAYPTRLTMWDLLQLAGITAPLLIIPDSWREAPWITYAPSAGVGSTILLGRILYQRHQYDQQSLPYTETVHTPTQQREPLPLFQSILLEILGIIGLYFGAPSFQQGWESIADTSKETTRWRVRLFGVLSAGLLVLVGARLFFNWKNRDPAKVITSPEAPIAPRGDHEPVTLDDRREKEVLSAQTTCCHRVCRQVSRFFARLRGVPESAPLIRGQAQPSESADRQSAQTFGLTREAGV